MPSRSGWVRAEATTRSFASTSLVDHLAGRQVGATGQVGERLDHQRAGDLARGVPAHAVGDEVDGGGGDVGVLVVAAHPSDVRGRADARLHLAPLLGPPSGPVQTITTTGAPWCPVRGTCAAIACGA
ncbi:hypothetical protein GCM10025868_23460 [Angustibacter aerolatus]|uniref:Uncharacterized protein n=1 Tax=Angustibacter aerolatus TaxID=1162965 RepID=A0ABQ6JJW9_9ACTN|nr:hypothetical protein GCM10025868_23460 [Angustibacter aerolatus]